MDVKRCSLQPSLIKVQVRRGAYKEGPYKEDGAPTGRPPTLLHLSPMLRTVYRTSLSTCACGQLGQCWSTLL
jgi:hypothetical protein